MILKTHNGFMAFGGNVDTALITVGNGTDGHSVLLNRKQMHELREDIDKWIKGEEIDILQAALDRESQ